MNELISVVVGAALTAVSVLEMVPQLHSESLVQNIIFPAPKPQYSLQTYKEIHLLDVDCKYSSSVNSDSVVYLHIKPLKTKAEQNHKYVFFYHGNACNIVECMPLLKELHKNIETECDKFAWHIVATEYPGYCPLTFGKQFVKNEVHIQEQAVVALIHLKKKFRIESDQDIILFGQSIGTGRESTQ